MVIVEIKTKEHEPKSLFRKYSTTITYGKVAKIEKVQGYGSTEQKSLVAAIELTVKEGY